MKLLLTTVALLVSCIVAPCQIIHTIAGIGGMGGYTGDGGPASAAEFQNPNSMVLDTAGNLYIADGDFNLIRKINKLGIITTIAGNGSRGYSGDGSPATDATLNSPTGLSIDKTGNIYIADWNNQVIRMINYSGIIKTIAGNQIEGYSGDGGPATAAKLNHPYATAVDENGNLYICDMSNYVIRKVAVTGTITTFAGNGTNGYSGNGSPATDAELSVPTGVAVDESGNVFIADSYNNVIRKVDTFGIITTIAGTGIAGYSGDGELATAAKLNSPISITLNKQGVYISDYSNNVIRKIGASGIISTVAGNSMSGYSGDGGLAIYAKIDQPLGLAVDRFGNFYFGDIYNFVVRMVDTSHTKESVKIINDCVSVRIYPNPASNLLMISSSVPIEHISITNAIGEIIFSEPIGKYGNRLQVNVKDFLSGIYFIHINGNGVTKFLKE